MKQICGKPKDPKRDRQLKPGYYCGREYGHSGQHQYKMFFRTKGTKKWAQLQR